jgi:5-methylcytosine-specific restriction endonuclease McrA
LTSGEMIAERAHFNVIKHTLMPLDNVTCYTCAAWAVHRHHVIPLCRGGASTLRNLVGLCELCHKNYDLVEHKERRIKREVTRVARVRNQSQQAVFRKGSLSRFSRVVYRP